MCILTVRRELPILDGGDLSRAPQTFLPCSLLLGALVILGAWMWKSLRGHEVVVDALFGNPLLALFVASLAFISVPPTSPQDSWRAGITYRVGQSSGQWVFC